jgi:malate/lactate dehydrogenase
VSDVGIVRIVESKLAEREQVQLSASAMALKNAIEQLGAAS